MKATLTDKKVLAGLALGQVISFLVTGTGISSQELASKYEVNIPTTQSSLNYILLMVVYMPYLYYVRSKARKEYFSRNETSCSDERVAEGNGSRGEAENLRREDEEDMIGVEEEEVKVEGKELADGKERGRGRLKSSKDYEQENGNLRSSRSRDEKERAAVRERLVNGSAEEEAEVAEKNSGNGHAPIGELASTEEAPLRYIALLMLDILLHELMMFLPIVLQKFCITSGGSICSWRSPTWKEIFSSSRRSSTLASSA
jgi:hypothetical protein